MAPVVWVLASVNLIFCIRLLKDPLGDLLSYGECILCFCVRKLTIQLPNVPLFAAGPHKRYFQLPSLRLITDRLHHFAPLQPCFFSARIAM